MVRLLPAGPRTGSDPAGEPACCTSRRKGLALADGPHFGWREEAEVEEARAVTGRSLQIGRGRRCSWSGSGAGGRESGPAWAY